MTKRQDRMQNANKNRMRSIEIMPPLVNTNTTDQKTDTSDGHV